MALRASSRIQPGLIARTHFRDPVIAVASPAYITNRGTPPTQCDLRTHRCLLGFARGDLPETHRPIVTGGNSTCRRVLGLGVALLPHGLVTSHLESGALVQVLADIIGAEMPIAQVYPERAFLPPQVLAFIDAVAAWVPRELAASQHARQRGSSDVVTEAKKAAPRSSRKSGF
ncbi:LysR substrate-binding domain-containing protein [Rhizobium bangladeshense]|uniref:LysR substrate-binding domain-containing protein n=1 Tax=Rhizobium bangladeshense TaxID=1138189 RepID=UPI001FEEB3AD|nr:LysR substrate-binding domain-containing protein [Rhizobium bangladeshense]